MGESPGSHPPADTPGTAPLRVDLLRSRSLLWLVPERAARWTGWAVVVLACIVPTLILLSASLFRSEARQEEALAALLSERLGGPVRLKTTGRDAPGHRRLADMSVGTPGVPAAASLRCPSGSYHAPANDPGRLDLEDGTLRIDLEAWTRGPTGTVVGILHKGMQDKALRAVSLSNFTVELHLGGRRLSLKQCVGRGEFTPDGNVEARLVGRTVAGQSVTVTLEVGDDLHRATVAGRDLPWTSTVLAPTLGEALAGLLEAPRGKLILANELRRGADDDHWMIEVDSGLDLGRLPESWGLGPMTGPLDVTLKAWGALGKPGNLTARFRLGTGAPAAVSDVALRNLRALLWGVWAELPEKPTTHALSALELSVIVTPNFLCLTRSDDDPPSGVFGADGDSLLGGPPGEVIPIGVFLERLEKLRRLWEEEHSS